MDSSSEHSASVRESSVDQSDEGDVVDGEESGDKGRRGRRGCIGRGRGVGRSRGASVHGTSRGRSSRGRGARGRGVCGAGCARGSTRAGGRMTERQKKVLLGDWKREESSALYFPFAGPQPGPVTAVTDDAAPLEVFERYFTSEVWDLIVDETNRYAATCREAQGATRAGRRRPWVDVTVEEMRAYIGVCILMGIVVLPRIDMYGLKSMTC